jgi:hypothetical protein
MWDFVMDKVALGQVFSENFGFPCQSTFQLLSTITIIYQWGLYSRPKWQQYLGTQSHPKYSEGAAMKSTLKRKITYSSSALLTRIHHDLCTQSDIRKLLCRFV